MKYFALSCVVLLGVGLGIYAQGPVTQGSESVAKKKTDPNAAPKSTDSTDTSSTAPDAKANTDKIPSKYKPNKDGTPQGPPIFSTDVLTVTLDVAVLDNKGNPIPKIPEERFRILEDNTPQKITGFNVGEAPMTVCMLIEFSARFQSLYSWGWMETLNDVYYFVQTLKPDDYVAVVAYDLRPEILSNFSQDRTDVQQALARLRIPGFSESALYDALAFTGERMQDIEGRKAIILFSSGVDTLSKLTFDKTRKAVQDNGVPIFAVGLLQAQREMMGAMRPGMAGAMSDMNLAVANQQLKTFATESGGRAFFPRFEGEMPGIYKMIHDYMRSSYTLTYQPSNQTKDGKYRRLKVELVNEDNQPLQVRDEKGKPIKVQIVTKAGYKAPREIE